MTPRDPISEHFWAGEFFPEACFPDPPAVELALTRLFVAEVLEPVRSFLGVPLTVNTAPGDGNARQASGWRFMDQTQKQPGAAGRLSDHMVLTVNPVAVGAVDIISVLSAAEVWSAFVLMASLYKTDGDKIVRGITPPREVIYERRTGGGTGWVHVGCPEVFKQREVFDFELGATPMRKARGVPLYGGQPYRWWTIQDTIRTAAKVGPVLLK